MKNVEHIGIAVRDLEASEALYAALLGTQSYKRETVGTEHVTTSFFRVGYAKIELLEATAAESPIARFIEKKGEGIHHLAFLVDDIAAEMERLRNEGFTLLSDVPRRGADNKLVCFVHPKSANGVLIELCQEIPQDT